MKIRRKDEVQVCCIPLNGNIARIAETTDVFTINVHSFHILFIFIWFNISIHSDIGSSQER